MHEGELTAHGARCGDRYIHDVRRQPNRRRRPNGDRGIDHSQQRASEPINTTVCASTEHRDGTREAPKRLETNRTFSARIAMPVRQVQKEAL